jgi:hypothetical protein
MDQWYELLNICSSVSYTLEKDAIIWHFHSSGRYSVQSLYAVVSDRDIRQIFTPVGWKITVPSRLHIFLWPLANNKVLTCDNLAKRRHVNDMSCLFCSEMESVNHLFFDCCIAKFMWSNVTKITGVALAVTLSRLLNVGLVIKKI